MFNHYYALTAEMTSLKQFEQEQEKDTPNETEILRQLWVKQAQEDGGLKKS
ncbi:hypothetical protein [Vibrio porteresiae]|uniref:Uncharacterized protein n=1 Tax=Vibrio porteresiae DSM 19223 TaxID=1123496 RepID=A0ABZ0QG02_9VIBR|nr:hypothetical protein [Vibrio porteresiae]WPC75434.1 hypothetical protein R8Z52_21120 [Vibrio porteresiae DSM 19223]